MSSDYDPLEYAKTKTPYGEAKAQYDSILKSYETKQLEEQNKRKEERAKKEKAAKDAQSKAVDNWGVLYDYHNAKAEADRLASISIQEGASAQDKQNYEKAKSKLDQAADKVKAAGEVINPATGNIGAPSTQGPNVGTASDATADQKAKDQYQASTFTATPDDALDQRKWVNAFTPGTNQDETVYRDPKGGASDPNTEVAVSFLANKSGNIYQTKDKRPEELQSAVNRIALEYQNSGKLNELRSLFIANKFITDPAAIQRINSMKQFSPNYADADTRTLIATAVKYATILNTNIANASTYGKRNFATFEDFVKSYKGSFNINNNQSGGGYAGPSYTKSINKQEIDPGDIEIAVDQIFQKYTGSGASAEDAKFIADKLTKSATTVTEMHRKGNVSTTTSTGGITTGDQQALMREQALNDPNAENYNKATTFLNYFNDALAAPIQLG